MRPSSKSSTRLSASNPTGLFSTACRRYAFFRKARFAIGGNSSRWINHSCDPNCYADERDGRIFITALRNIQAGEELNYDYGLIIEERYTKKLKAEYPCWCGAANCRGTLLAPKRGWAPPVPLPPAKPSSSGKAAKTAKTGKKPQAKGRRP